MNKYVVNNCEQIHSSDNFCWSKNIFCQDCTDCIIKQIVELCKDVKCPCEYKGSDCWECVESGVRRFADKILKLLDIQDIKGC